jgi:hypothetical protein
LPSAWADRDRRRRRALVYTRAIAPPTGGYNDTFWYRTLSSEIARGHGFVVPVGRSLRLEPTALHPPLYPLVLAGAQKLCITSDDGLRSLGAPHDPRHRAARPGDRG